MNLLAQFFGFLALCVLVIALQMKEKNRSLIFIGFANLLFAINFLLLEAYSGSVMCFLGVIQSIVFYIYNKKEKKTPIYIIILFIIFALLVGIFTYSDIYSVFPIVAGILNMFAMSTKNMKFFRVMNFVISALWITYDIVSGAYISLLSHLISLASVSMAIIRYDVIKKIGG